jgi:hypothetical protein
VSTWSPRRLAFLALVAALGCSRVPTGDEERFALDLISLVRHGRTDEALARMEPSLRTPATRSSLKEIEHSFPEGEPIRVDTIGGGVLTNMSTGERMANFTFQFQYASAWLLANVVVRTAGSERSARGFHVRALPDSLRRLNAFTWRRKSFRHFALAALAVVAFATSVAGVVACARSRIRRKPLWLLVSAFGVGQVMIDWTTGTTASRPFSVQLLSVGIQRANEFAPWILSISVPVGAILFFSLQQKLARQALASRHASPPG